MTSVKNFGELLKIADCAMRLHEAEIERREARETLRLAYRGWKHRNAVNFVHRDTLEWIQMTAATEAEHDALERAKARERNARKRLSAAVVRAQIQAVDLVAA